MTFFSSFGSLGISRICSSCRDCRVARLSAASFFLGQVAHLGVAALQQLLGAGDVLLDRLVLAVLLDERLEFRERLGGLADTPPGSDCTSAVPRLPISSSYLRFDGA